MEQIRESPNRHIVGSHMMAPTYRKKEGKPMWMIHLEKMVTEEEPLRYLKKYCDRYYSPAQHEVNSVIDRLGVD